MFVLLSGVLPFKGHSQEEIFSNVKKGEFKFSPSSIWEYVSPSAKDLINLLIKKNYFERISAEEALNHPWIKEFSDKKTKLNKPLALTALQNLKNYRVKIITLIFKNNLLNIKASNKIQNAISMFIVTFLTTKDEKNIFFEAFKQIDLDGDGKITQNELLHGIRVDKLILLTILTIYLKLEKYLFL